jgi:hypothetical protein
MCSLPLLEQTKVQELESFVGTTFPSIIKIKPLDVTKTKGSGKKLKSGLEEAEQKEKVYIPYLT